jgi:malonate-semialdehyde dehydrogenase (acetylating) / methylmalonate-semialdehyde dehydrogenase
VSTLLQKNIQQEVLNYADGKWSKPVTTSFLDIQNPATGELLGRVPDSTRADVDAVVRSAAAAFPGWRRTPPEDRIQYLFKLKALLETHFDDIARITTLENGKTIAESRAELRRAIENVEVACGIPTLMQGYNLEDVAAGIDEIMIRQPLGVVAAITPFNFPTMIPFWFLPYAIACGNTFILKPSEKVPLSSRYIFDLMAEIGLPPGVLNLLNGGKTSVDGLLRHPDVRAISFVGSTHVARYIYAEAAKHGKRVQCQGGAKNHVVIAPDADLKMATKIVADSAFGCAGQRCLAVSVAIALDEIKSDFTKQLIETVSSIRVGNGLDESVQMGPVITPQSKSRIESLITAGERDGGTVLLDGRKTGSASKTGNFVGPTLIADVPPQSAAATEEIFGPVLNIVNATSLDQAIEILGRSPYGNAASIFTSSGAVARKFRYEAPTGNIGVNIGVAAPMAYFPFSGWKDSFLGVLHGQGRDAVQFYTEQKVVIERWPNTWSRQF